MTLVDLRVARQRITRVQVKRHIETFHRRPERPILRQVVIDGCFSVVDLREAIDQRAAKAELLHAALEFTRRARRILHRQCRKSLKPVRPLAHLLGEIIVRLRRAISSAFAGSGMAWTAGALSDNSIISMPYSSICDSRRSCRSSTRAFHLLPDLVGKIAAGIGNRFRDGEMFFECDLALHAAPPASPARAPAR